eukprot:4886735-Heterocapsa_arctica.AAC.1
MCGQISEVAHRAGAAVVLENPLRAWFWLLESIARLLRLEGWQDFDYCACCVGAARAKQQRLRTNVEA